VALDFPAAPVAGDKYSGYVFSNGVWDIDSVTSPTSAAMGDVKSGFQTADHDGWILLNGRAVSTLTATQQVEATKLGFTTNLPNGDKCSLRQMSAALGSVGGSEKITQANLPAVNLTAANAAVLTTSQAAATAGTTGSSGNHQHVYQSNINDQGIQNFNELLSGRGGSDPATKYPVVKWRGSATIANDANNGTIRDGFAHNVAGDHNHSVTVPAHTHTVPAHGHSVPLGGGATDYWIKAIITNFFVFLGA
jgi:hypothetical protein